MSDPHDMHIRRCGTTTTACVASAVSAMLLLGVAAAKPPVPAGYVRSVVKTNTEETAFADIDGDGRKDLITLRETQVAWHLQTPENTFPKSADTKINTDIKAGIVCMTPAQDGRRAEILIAASSGLFRVHPGAEPLESLLECPTLLPKQSSTPRLLFAPFVVPGPVGTKTAFLPTPQGLAVWSAKNGVWAQTGVIADALQNLSSGPERNVAYLLRHLLDMTQQDTNHDGLPDMLIGLPAPHGNTTVGVFRQKEDGGFGTLPDLRLTWPSEENAYVQLEDVNRDGLPDIVRNTPDRAPWIIPGTFSGKVLVRVHLTNTDGQSRNTPDFLFRRNDWSMASSLVDIDANGHPDMVFGYLRINGVDDMIRLAREKRLPLELRVFLYGENGFTKEPTFAKDLELSLNRIHLQFDFELMPTIVKRFLCLDGDFNGDGLRDLVVKRNTKEIAVYYLQSPETGFSRRPDLTFSVGNTHRLGAEDLNGDTRSDLIVDLNTRTKLLFISSD